MKLALRGEDRQGVVTVAHVGSTSSDNGYPKWIGSLTQVLTINNCNKLSPSCREHAMLAKTAGVKHLVVLINKMDDPTVGWSEERCVNR